MTLSRRNPTKNNKGIPVPERIIPALLLTCWFITSVFLLFHSVLSIDEGFYLASSKFFLEGMLPYRDFAFPQPPLFPVLNALMLKFIGFDLLGIRITSLLWNTVGVVIGYTLLVRKLDRKTGILFLILILMSPGWLAYGAKGSNYPLPALMTMLATAVYSTRPGNVLNWTFFTVFCAFAAATRYQTLGLLLPLSVVFLLQIPKRSSRFLAVAIAALLLFLTLVLTSMGDWESFRFWTIDYHLSTQLKIDIFQKVEEFRILSPVAILLLLFIAFKALKQKTERNTLITTGCFLFAFGINFFPKNAYGGYSTVFVPALVFYTCTQSSSVVRLLLNTTPGLLAAGFAASTITAFTVLLPHRVPLTVFNTVVDTLEAQEVLKQVTKPEDQVVTVAPEIVIGAGRKLPAALAFGAFSITTSINPIEAKKLNYLTISRLLELIEDRNTKAIVLTTQPSLNFSISTPDMQQIQPKNREQIYSKIQDLFKPAYASQYYVIFDRKAENECEFQANTSPLIPK